MSGAGQLPWDVHTRQSKLDISRAGQGTPPECDQPRPGFSEGDVFISAYSVAYSVLILWLTKRDVEL